MAADMSRWRLFEKKLLSYIYQQNTVESFAGYPYTSAQPPIITEGIASQYVNGQGGNVSGVEGTVQIGSEVFTGGAIRGFGVVLNGLLVDSNIQPWGPGNGNAPLNDLAKKSANITLYYESHGFSARVIDHYQSSDEGIHRAVRRAELQLGGDAQRWLLGRDPLPHDRRPAQLRVQDRPAQGSHVLP